jgi:hypothetical protein
LYIWYNEKHQAVDSRQIDPEDFVNENGFDGFFPLLYFYYYYINNSKNNDYDYDAIEMSPKLYKEIISINWYYK